MRAIGAAVALAARRGCLLGRPHVAATSLQQVRGSLQPASSLQVAGMLHVNIKDGLTLRPPLLLICAGWRLQEPEFGDERCFHICVSQCAGEGASQASW